MLSSTFHKTTRQCNINNDHLHAPFSCYFFLLTLLQQGTVQLLRDVAAWLVINSMKSEKVQFNLLCEQSIGNVWRKHAYRTLLERRSEVGAAGNSGKGTQGGEMVKDCIDIFRQKVHFNVENSVPESQTFSQVIAKEVSLFLFQNQRGKDDSPLLFFSFPRSRCLNTVDF